MSALEAFSGDEAVAEWLQRYQPAGIDTAVWFGPVRPFVLAAVCGLRPPGLASAARYARRLSGLAAWGFEEGLAIDREVLLDPAVVERHVTVGPFTDKSRATARADLRRMGRLLTTTAPWEPRPGAMARRSVAVPYPPDEVDSLWRAATSQPTPGRSRSAQAIIALGAGAGLDGRWNTRIAGDDVVTRPGVVLVQVPGPVARLVPVLAAWEERVLALARAAGPSPLVGRHSTSRNRASRLQHRALLPAGCSLLSANRLRSTWMVTHLRSGTRLPELAAAAGLEGVTVLSDLLAFVERLPNERAWTELRGDR